MAPGAAPGAASVPMQPLSSKSSSCPSSPRLKSRLLSQTPAQPQIQISNEHFCVVGLLASGIIQWSGDRSRQVRKVNQVLANRPAPVLNRLKYATRVFSYSETLIMDTLMERSEVTRIWLSSRRSSGTLVESFLPTAGAAAHALRPPLFSTSTTKNFKTVTTCPFLRLIPATSR